MSVIIGFLLGVTFFLIFENSLSNSFFTTCWERHQPKLLVHNKVYLLGSFIIYRGFVSNDIYITMIGASWIGLHLIQDISERINERKNKKTD
jgi:hypothetical protein